MSLYKMGYWGYNPCKSSYFTLLIRVFLGPPSTRLTNLLGPLLTQGGHKSKFIWTVPGCLLLQSIYRNTLPENWTNVHPKQGPISKGKWSKSPIIIFQGTFVSFRGSSVHKAHILPFFLQQKQLKQEGVDEKGLCE